ncbi:putative capsular polysaccharide biosynthesis protein [Enterococcus faecalis 13-SD-W-01]|nr:putative capsular polysaccharide biosynthesis protein [Enterococcus faecalis 13-SD-W-01]
MQDITTENKAQETREMIDLHCHILPGIDDGAETLEASIDMAEKAISQGITHILCTPHHNNGKYRNEKSEVISLVSFLQSELEKRQLPITLLEGQEIRITGDLIEDIRRDEILFTDLDDTYLLIEFPTLEVPLYTEQLFFELLKMGKRPVIVHPERNAHFRKNPNHLLPFLDMGCLAQLTAPSYMGVFGKDIQKTAKTMVKHNLVQMAASDAHGVSKRTFYLKECYEQIAKDFGQEKVAQMKQVAKDLINGDEVAYPEYTEVKKKFGLF